MCKDRLAITHSNAVPLSSFIVLRFLMNVPHLLGAMAAVLLLSVSCVLSRDVPPQAHIEAAFAADNFTRVRWAAAPGGARGALAFSTTATNLRTGEPKRAVYVEGNAHQMGFLQGFLQPERVHTLCNEFLNVIPLALLDAKWVREHNGTVVREMEKVIAYLLEVESVRLWKQQSSDASLAIPGMLEEEMEGIVQGVAAANASLTSHVTVDRLITLNFGFDLITIKAFSGHLLPMLRELSKRLHMERLWRSLGDASFTRGMMHSLPYCDAIGVRGAFTRDTGASFMGRAYQFQVARVLQDLLTMTVYSPISSADGGGMGSGGQWPERAIVSINAPGFVGSFAGINEDGVAVGVDTIRAPNGNQSVVGLNSVLLLRSVLHESGDVEEAIAYATNAHRGAPFLYPMCDVNDCAVLEAGMWLPEGAPEDPLQYVSHKLKDRSLTPSTQFLAQHPTDTFAKGLYVRRMNYTYDDSYMTTFNKDLFAYAGMAYNATKMELGQFLFPSWQQDNAAEPTLANNYFFPQKENDDDVILVTNFAIVPQDRLTMMNYWDDLFARSAESIYWRYDKLTELLYEKKGEIDFDTAIWIMRFLAPDRTPGYWNETIIPSDPMSAIVEGSVSVYDLQLRRVSALSGYWADEMTNITLPAYL